MKRRRFIASTGAFVGLTGCASSAADIGTIASDTTPPPGAGVTDMGWRLVDRKDRTAGFVMRYGSPPPAFLRLIAPGGAEYFRNEAPPEKGEDSLQFTLPIKQVGEWTLATEDSDGESSTETFLFNRSFDIESAELNRDTMTLSAQNTGTVPNVWVSYVVKAGPRVESFDVGRVMTPAERVTIERHYPFDHYDNVRIHLYDGIDTHDESRFDLL